MARRKTAAGSTLARALLLAWLMMLPLVATAQPDAGLPQARAATEGASPQSLLPQIAGVDVRAVLAASGSFVRHPAYGEVWVPTATPQGWHPYPACHWVDTQALGWYFVDPTPWGSIVHHYGRWTRDGQLGWIWVPSPEFSPGWVVWRTSPRWVGWAPVPPDADLRTISTDRLTDAGSWQFAETGKLEKGCDGVVAAAPQLPALLQQTRFVTRLEYAHGIMIAVLPSSVVGETRSVASAFDPWPAWFVTKIVFDWNWIWTHAGAATRVAGACPPAPK